MLTLLKALLISFSSFSLTFEGEFNGQGYWKNNVGQGDLYTVDLLVKNQNHTSTYHDRYGSRSRQFNIVSNSKDESVLIQSNGQTIGNGHCLSQSCQFNWTDNGDQIQENWIWDDSKITRIGKRTTQRGWVIWEEKSKRK